MKLQNSFVFFYQNVMMKSIGEITLPKRKKTKEKSIEAAACKRLLEIALHTHACMLIKQKKSRYFLNKFKVKKKKEEENLWIQRPLPWKN